MRKSLQGPRGHPSVVVVSIAAAALLLASGSRVFASGGAHVFGGMRSLPSDPWGPVGPGLVLGVNADGGAADWPVNISAGYQAGWTDLEFEDTGARGDVSIHEISLGILCAKTSSTWGRAFIGGGLSRISARAELHGRSSSGSAPALYAHAGAFLGPDGYSIGIEVRAALAADIELYGEGGPASYVQVSLIFAGFAFGP